MVKMSASICGCHSLVSPFHTGPRVIGELFDGGLGGAAERDAVIHAAQHPGRVRDGRLLAAVGTLGPEVGDAPAAAVQREPATAVASRYPTDCRSRSMARPDQRVPPAERLEDGLIS